MNLICPGNFFEAEPVLVANVKEALRGQSRPDFGSKMNIALKEASESEYWIELLIETSYIRPEQGDSLLNECREIIKLLTSIV